MKKKMKKKGKARLQHPAKVLAAIRKQLALITSEVEYEKKHRDKLWEKVAELSERMQEAEVQINVNTRLLTYVCIEELGISTTRIRKLLRRIEKETKEDQQIVMLEELFRKKSRPRKDRSGLDEEAG